MRLSPLLRHRPSRAHLEMLMCLRSVKLPPAAGHLYVPLAQTAEAADLRRFCLHMCTKKGDSRWEDRWEKVWWWTLGSLAQLRAHIQLALASMVSRSPFSWHSLWGFGTGRVLLCNNNRPQTGKVAVCIVHCGAGLSNGGSMCIVRRFWKRICGLQKGIWIPLLFGESAVCRLPIVLMRCQILDLIAYTPKYVPITSSFF